MRYGYGRVSTNTQDTALQEDAFRRAGIRRPVTEKWSSVGARPALMALIAKLRPGDELVVWKLDRLGRSLQDLLSILDRIHASGAAFRSLTEPIDTRTPAGKLMYSILGAVGEFERSIIRERAIAGQVAAYSRGKRWGGQKPAIEAGDLVKLYTMKDSGMYTHAQIAAHFGCSLSTVDRALAKRRDPKRAQKKRLPVLRRFLDGADPSSSCH